MKKNRFLYLSILLTAFLFSCKGPHKTDTPKAQPVQENPPIKDYDPYFVETQNVKLAKGPSSITRNLLEDAQGNIWFASWEGIMSYQPSKVLQGAGQPFTNHTNKEKLRRYHVFSVLRDKREQLWFGTIRGGLYRYDPSTEPPSDSFTNFTKEDGLAGDLILCMYEDRSGKIWIGTSTGISLFDPSTSKGTAPAFQNFIIEGSQNNNDVNSIIEDRNGTFWIGTRGTVFCYDGKTFTNFHNIGKLHLSNVRSIIEDKNGNIWLGGNEGLWRYNPSEGASSLTNFTKEFVGYIYEDRNGNIWTGSVKMGDRDWTLIRYDAIALSEGLNPVRAMHRQNGQIFGILEDSNGNIWFGHERGVCRFDPKVAIEKEIALECFTN